MIKKLAVLLVLAAVLGGLVWLVWFKPPTAPEEEAAPPTEVAVHVGKITRTTLHGFLSAYGTVTPQPAGVQPAASAHVAPSVPGVVVEVNCAEGRTVSKGDILFQLDSRAADVAVAFAEKTLDRQKKLSQVDGTSQKALQEAQQQLDAARVQQALLRVRAPLSGTVTRLNAKAGEAVDLTTVLADITDLNRLDVLAAIPSAFSSALKSGENVELLTNPPVKTVVSFISPVVDPTNDTVMFRAALTANSGLLPGQFVHLRLETAQHTDCLAAPAESVVTDAEGKSVVAVVTGDLAAQLSVTVGLREGGLVEVDSPSLKEGDTVVTTGAYGLPAKTKVRVISP